MKIRTWLLPAAAVVSLLATSLRADDVFQLFWRGTYYTKDSTGHIVAVRFTKQDFVNQVAQNNGLDPSQLVFVYRPGKRDAAVALGALRMAPTPEKSQATDSLIAEPASQSQAQERQFRPSAGNTRSSSPGLAPGAPSVPNGDTSVHG